MTPRRAASLATVLAGFFNLLDMPIAHAAPKPYPDEWFVRTAAPIANDALSKDEATSCSPTAHYPDGGPWVDRTQAKVIHEGENVATVSWQGRSAEGVAYRVQVKLTVDESGGNQSDLGWHDVTCKKDGAAGKPAAVEDTDAKYAEQAAWMANVELQRYYESRYEKTCNAAHTGPWVEPGKATIKRRGAKGSAAVSWEGTTSDGMEYAVTVGVDLSRDEAAVSKLKVLCKKP